MTKARGACTGTVFFANGLGDCILTLPSLRALVRLFPGPLTLVTGGCPADLLFSDCGFSRILTVQMSRVGLSNARDFDATYVAQKLGRQDVLFSLAPWSAPALRQFARGSGFATTFGFGAGFDFRLHPDAHTHAADRAFELIRKLDARLDIMAFSHPFPLPQAAVAAASDVRRAVGEGGKILVVHEETFTPAKCWDPGRMRELLGRFTHAHPEVTAIVVSRRGPRFDTGGLEDRVVPISNVAFGFFLALIAEADFFLGVDSIGFHVADMWRIPAVGLFGPSSPQEWGARFSDQCRHVDGHGSMDNISVDKVLDALWEILPAPAHPFPGRIPNTAAGR